MSDITSLDVTEVRSLPTFAGTSGEGSKTTERLSAYSRDLTNIKNQGFGPNDTSTAQSVMGAVLEQIPYFEEIINEVNCTLDEAIGMLNTDIIDKEDSLAATIVED